MNAILMIGRKEVAITLITNAFFIQTKFTQRINQHLNRITGIRIGPGNFHPGPMNYIGLFQFTGNHERFIFQRYHQRLKEGITGGLIIRQIHNVFRIGNHHGIHMPFGNTFA